MRYPFDVDLIRKSLPDDIYKFGITNNLVQRMNKHRDEYHTKFPDCKFQPLFCIYVSNQTSFETKMKDYLKERYRLIEGTEEMFIIPEFETVEEHMFQTWLSFMICLYSRRKCYFGSCSRGIFHLIGLDGIDKECEKIDIWSALSTDLDSGHKIKMKDDSGGHSIRLDKVDYSFDDFFKIPTL